MSALETFPPHHAFPDVALTDIVAELRREAAARRQLYPRLAAKGRMTPAEVAEGHAVIAALIADCDRIAPMRCSEEAHDFTWAQRRAALQRELAYRARLYPKWIAAGDFDEAEAQARNRRLQALLAIFDDGFDWRPRSGLRAREWMDATAEVERASRIEWRTHAFAVALARGDFATAEGYVTMTRQLGAHQLAGEMAERLHAHQHPEQQKEMAL